MWEWAFGDGTLSTEQSPQHTYHESGTYAVTLLITDDNGSTDTIAHDLVIELGQPTMGPILPISAGAGILAMLILLILKKRR